MKCKVVPATPAILFLAVLGLSMATPMWAEVHKCSNATAAGKWTLISTGILILPTGSVQVAAVGTFVQDTAGNLSGSQTRSLNGGIADETFKGNATVNSDCTATYVVEVFQSGVLVRTTTLQVIFDDNVRSARGIFTSLVLPNSASVPTVITLDAKRLFPNGQDQE